MHGRFALQLVVVAPKRGTEQGMQLNMGVLIVLEATLKANPAILIHAQV